MCAIRSDASLHFVAGLEVMIALRRLPAGRGLVTVAGSALASAVPRSSLSACCSHWLPSSSSTLLISLTQLYPYLLPQSLLLANG